MYMARSVAPSIPADSGPDSGSLVGFADESEDVFLEDTAAIMDLTEDDVLLFREELALLVVAVTPAVPVRVATAERRSDAARLTVAIIFGCAG